MANDRIVSNDLERRPGNGSPRAIVTRRGEGEPVPAALGSVARDAIDHATIILRDTAAIAKLEGEKIVDRAVKDVAPKVAFGAVAAISGFVGLVFALIAIFIGLGEVIPSVAWRLVIFAVAFFAVAIAGAVLAGKRRETSTERRIRESMPGAPVPEHHRREERHAAV
jgi:hypothetical protein